MRWRLSPPARATERGVGEQHAALLGHAADLRGQAARRLEAAVVEAVAGRVDVRRDGVVEQDRAEQQQSRRAAAPVGDVGRDVVDVPVQGVGDRRRRAPEARLEVVAAEHHHDDVERVVRQQRGREVRAAVAVRAVDVVDVGGAAVEPFLDHLVAVAEQPLQPAGPPDVGAEPHVLRVVSRRAVGVGVAEAEHAYGVGVGAHVSAGGRRPARRRGRVGAPVRSPRAGSAQVLRGFGFAGASPLIEAITATRAATSSGVASPRTTGGRLLLGQANLLRFAVSRPSGRRVGASSPPLRSSTTTADSAPIVAATPLTAGCFRASSPAGSRAWCAAGAGRGPPRRGSRAGR